MTETPWKPAPTTADVGSLPAPSVEAPISMSSFRALCQAWRPSRLWLTLWNVAGDCVASDDDAPRLWRALWREPAALRAAMKKCVRDAIQNSSTPAKKPSGTTHTAIPLLPELALFITPLYSHRRVSGVIVAGALTTRTLSESFTRLCNESQLDVATIRKWAADATIPQAGELERIGALFHWTLDMACQLDIGHQEVAALTHNLESTYEELHLMYKIGGKLSFLSRPMHLLSMVGRDLLDVCRASGFAFVLKEANWQHDVAGARIDPSSGSLAERIVQVGQAAPALSDLDRLAESLQLAPDSHVEHLVVNDPARRPELRWATAWLRHLVALPLWHERQLLGVMLAMNCTDDGDFTSVDVQLFRAVADRIAPFLQNRRLYDDLADLLMGMLHALVNSIDAKDTYTCGHSERVAFFARALAEAAGLPAATCERIYLSGLLHDVGKIGVPDAILCKTGKLTSDEFDSMRRHPEIGARILADVRQIQDLLPGVLHHHERMDGRGYPAGLAAQEIPLFGRLICIADCFDAMTTNRTYRAALPLPVAVAEVRRCSGTQFDPHLAEIFLNLDHAKLFSEARAISKATDVLRPAGSSRVAGQDMN